ncbi:hypothetical protein K402DRAFT_430291 [Aulographum hederae CBS 113979]|uniref:Uncharacterized protein n=1 Tax=Aulographum hederae CBS 113979 TaxID=1176131 RepID=A0A6G1HFP1_9PEZI|nr:hypothetical protein K402DRAFT_430291 [Aulographum hederae CBS 113979]
MPNQVSGILKSQGGTNFTLFVLFLNPGSRHASSEVEGQTMNLPESTCGLASRGSSAGRHIWHAEGFADGKASHGSCLLDGQENDLFSGNPEDGGAEIQSFPLVIITQRTCKRQASECKGIGLRMETCLAFQAKVGTQPKGKQDVLHGGMAMFKATNCRHTYIHTHVSDRTPGRTYNVDKHTRAAVTRFRPSSFTHPPGDQASS